MKNCCIRGMGCRSPNFIWIAVLLRHWLFQAAKHLDRETISKNRMLKFWQAFCLLFEQVVYVLLASALRSKRNDVMEMVIEKPARREIHESLSPEEPKTKEKTKSISLAASAEPVIETLPAAKAEKMYITPQTEEVPSRAKGSYKSFGLALVIVTVTFVLKWLISSVLV